MSRKPTANAPQDELGTIIAAAAGAAQDSAMQATPESRIAELERRIADIEPLLEQIQANSKIGPKLEEYIDDLRKEQVFFNLARYGVGLFSVLAIVGIAVLLSLAIFVPKSPILNSAPIVIATFVVGMVSGIVILINSFVKGVFRSTAERHSDGFLPPALEKAVELMNKVVGKG